VDQPAEGPVKVEGQHMTVYVMDRDSGVIRKNGKHLERVMLMTIE
jgi:hypothetical protein